MWCMCKKTLEENHALILLLLRSGSRNGSTAVRRIEGGRGDRRRDENLRGIVRGHDDQLGLPPGGGDGFGKFVPRQRKIRRDKGQSTGKGEKRARHGGSVGHETQRKAVDAHLDRREKMQVRELE